MRVGWRGLNKPIPHLAVMLAIVVFVVCGLFGAFGAWDMSPPSQVALVILLVAATLWISETVPLFVTSFIILAMSIVWLEPVIEAAGLPVERRDFLAPFFSDIILLFLGGFVLSSAMHKYQLDERMARWVIARTGRSVPRLVMGVMCITAFLSMWLSNTATTAMMLTLCLPIVHSLPAGDRYRKAILLAVPFAANIGGLGTPIGTPPNAIAMQYLAELGNAPGFVQWMVIGVPMAVVMLLVAWVVLMMLYRGKVRHITLDEQGELAPWSFKAYVVLAVTLLTAAGWLTGAWHGYSSGTIALIPVLVFFSTRILTVADFRALSWDVLLVMGGGLCLGGVIQLSGLADWLIARVPADGASVMLLAVIFGVVACVMSTVMSNTATANLIMPIMVGLSVAPMCPLLVTVAFCCSLAMALPISTPPNAITFSSGEITVKDMMRPGLILTVVGLIVTFTVGRWWWDLVGLF